MQNRDQNNSGPLSYKYHPLNEKEKTRRHQTAQHNGIFTYFYFRLIFVYYFQ